MAKTPEALRTHLEKLETLIPPGYEIIDAPEAQDGKAIRCYRCNGVSYHPGDVVNRYCPRCAIFHHERRSQ